MAIHAADITFGIDDAMLRQLRYAAIAVRRCRHAIHAAYATLLVAAARYCHAIDAPDAFSARVAMLYLMLPCWHGCYFATRHVVPSRCRCHAMLIAAATPPLLSRRHYAGCFRHAAIDFSFIFAAAG